MPGLKTSPVATVIEAADAHGAANAKTASKTAAGQRRATQGDHNPGGVTFGHIGKATLFALIASSALPIGGYIGAWRPPSRTVTAALLAFASGALISAVAFELFEAAFTHGGAWRAGSAFLAGATVFIVVDSLLERRKEGRRAAGMGIGFALLAAVTLDGVPENIAMGVALVDTGNAALLVAIFVSNFPEAVVGAEKMREAGLERGAILLIWTATAVLLGVSVIVGYGAFSGLSGEALSWPLGFAGGAVLASLADTLMPEAFEEAKEDPRIAYFTSLGFLLSFLVAAA